MERVHTFVILLMETTANHKIRRFVSLVNNFTSPLNTFSMFLVHDSIDKLHN